MNLNKEQESAVSCGGGPVLVLAGPGSGKTTVITQRILWLIEHGGAAPSNILVVTFTRAAADEMRQRFYSLAGGKKSVSFGTFHSIFFAILRSAYGFTADNIIREEEKYEFMRQIVEKMHIDTDNVAEFSTNVLSEISIVKGNLMDVKHYYSSVCAADIFQNIYAGYAGMLEEKRLLDFDDMMIYTRELFLKRKDILAAWQNKFRYILVDEFQDISPVQYQLVRMLSAPQNNLFVVGDDDQSIYGFRGANPEIMLGFEKDYPGARKILLPVNYRSQKLIVDGAGAVIKHNRNRFPKDIYSSRPSGSLIDIRRFSGISQETKAVLDRITAMHENGLNYSDIAILFRTNTQARPYIERLMEYNIPFTIQDAVPDIYQHWVAKDILSYMRIAYGGRARSDFLRIINKPNRYINRNVFSSGQVDVNAVYKIYRDKPWMIRRLDRLFYDMKILATLKPEAALSYIRKDIGYGDYLEEYAGKRGMDVSGLTQVLDELSESASSHESWEEWYKYILDFSASLKEKNKAGKNQEPEEQDCLPLATMHHSKGLEYKAVIIVDANEGVTPYRKAVTEDAIEEERRMFYVAMTRAKDDLSIFFIKERYGRVMKTSRFVNELIGK